MKILYLLSRHTSREQIETCLTDKSVSKVYLCPLEYGCESRIEDVLSFCKVKNIEVEVLKSLEIINQNAFKLRDQYIQWIYEISQSSIGSSKTLEDFYKFDGGLASVWWLSLINEKNPYKSDTFVDFVKIMTSLDLIKIYKIDSLWIDQAFRNYSNILKKSSLKIVLIDISHTRDIFRVIKNHGFFIFLYEQLRHKAAFVNLVLRVMGARKALKGLSQRVQALSQANVLAFTMFPLVDKDALDRGEFVNRAYGLIDKAFKESPELKVSWLAMFTKIDALGWPQALRLGQQLNEKGKNIIFYEECLGLKEIAGILKTDIVTTLKTLWNLNTLRKLFIYRADGIWVDFWDLFKRDVLSSFAGKQLVVELGMYYAFKGVFKHLPVNAKILYFAELHAWENSLNMSRRKYESLKAIGLQHTIMPLLYLSYFRDPRELKGGASTLPQPDYLATTGEVTKNLLYKNGWEKNKLFSVGGFRFQTILERKLSPVPVKRNQIVVALSISDKENAEILEMLKDAFVGITLDVKVLLKPHPCNNLPALIERMQLSLDKRFEITNNSLNVLVPESKAMIVKESSSIFEALASNVPVIVPQLYSIADLCPLSGVFDVSCYVYNAKELTQRINDILAEAPHPAGKVSSEDILKQYIYPFDKEALLKLIK
jgi:surface carbohydrate biosynthesis protein (TIGR04326 family)